MLIHTDPASVSSVPHTVLMIGAPVRLDWLFNATLKRGIYFIEGDLRNKVTTRIGQRQIQAGLVRLEYMGETPKAPIVVEETPQPISVPQEILKPELEMKDSDPVVVLDEPVKKKGKKGKVVVEETPEPKIDSHEENSLSTVQEPRSAD